MTWLINVDNGGTTTGFCHVDGGEVRYTKTLTTLHRIERQTGRPLHDPRSSAELFVALEALRTLPGPVATPEADRITPRRPLAASDNRDAPPQQAI